MWDNHSGIIAAAIGCPRRTTAKFSIAGKRPMLNELEFAYAPVREKVRDLREYL